MTFTLADLLRLLIRCSMLSTVFAIGLRASWNDVLYLTHQPRLLLRSLLAMYVLTPLAALLLIQVIPAPPPIKVAVMFLAISPGAPALPKRLLKLGGNPAYVHSLGVVMALVSIITVPLWLWGLDTLYHQHVSVPTDDLVMAIGTAFVAPLAAALLFQRFWPSLASRLANPLLRVASLLQLTLLVIILAVNGSAIFEKGLAAAGPIVALTLAALAIGHACGGPDPGNRTTLALVSAIRFPALGLLIASLNFPRAKPLPLMAASLLLANLAVIPYVWWRKRQRRPVDAAPPGENPQSESEPRG